MIINANSEEYLIETKVYYYEKQFTKGKNQLAYYCKSIGLKTSVYIIFCPNHVKYPASIKEKKEIIEGIEIFSYLVYYDDIKWE